MRFPGQSRCGRGKGGSCRELLELINIFASVMTFFQPSSRILVVSDCLPAVQIARRRYCGKSENMQSIITNFDLFCISHCLKVSFEHREREDVMMKRCDLLSRNQVEEERELGMVQLP